jgi:hypothetical protein
VELHLLLVIIKFIHLQAQELLQLQKLRQTQQTMKFHIWLLPEEEDLEIMVAEALEVIENINHL